MKRFDDDMGRLVTKVDCGDHLTDRIKRRIV